LARLELVTLVQIRIVEASMGGMFRKSGETVSRIYRNWGIGIFALPVLIAIALVGLVHTRPAASNWISDAVQTGVAGSKASPDAAPAQLAQPATANRTVRAN
jgi:hypothetical protein